MHTLLLPSLWHSLTLQPTISDTQLQTELLLAILSPSIPLPQAPNAVGVRRGMRDQGEGCKLLTEDAITSSPLFTGCCQVIEDQRVAVSKHSYSWSAARRGWLIHVHPLPLG